MLFFLRIDYPSLARLIFACSLPLVSSIYVSYEQPHLYRVGDQVQLMANKLTSSVTLSPIDYPKLPICNESNARSQPSKNRWDDSLSRLHGDFSYPVQSISINFGYDVFCARACRTALRPLDSWNDRIQQDYYYNFILDGLPAISKSETDFSLTTRYFGGIPMGSKQSDLIGSNSRYNSTFEVTGEASSFVNNHWNIEVWYTRANGASDTFVIVRVIVEPFSVQQWSNSTISGTTSSQSMMASCVDESTTHTSYDILYDIPLQPLDFENPILFTYDVIWIEASDEAYDKRWEEYLSMDDAVPNYIEFSGFFLGAFILLSLTGILCTWVLRDLSYKPIVNQAEEFSDTETKEIEMWPLSTRIFFAPTKAPILLCVACGTGAHILFTSSFFIVLFRIGVINQSLGAQLLTPGIVLYSLSSSAGGYVTARLSAVFHFELKIALASSLITAIAFPLVGLVVVYFAYDVLPLSDAPSYIASSTITPMILLWIFFIWPVTLIFGFVGYSHGPIQNFPVSEGSNGYHDLNLQGERDSLRSVSTHNRWCWRVLSKKCRIPILLATGGLLPMLSCFVTFSYGIAGPIIIGYYSVRPYMIASFLIFILSSGIIAALLFYRQIRTQFLFDWWWASFATSGSAGIYVFVLSVSYILFRGEASQLIGRTITLYLVWFAYLSFGVLLMNGFVGVALTMTFIGTMYTFIIKRQQSH